MKRTLFFTLSVFFACQSACGAVEIYAAGRRYISFEAYQEAQNAAQASAAAVALDRRQKSDDRQENDIRRQAGKLGIKMDLSAHRLYVLGAENGMNKALQDFNQKPGETGPRAFRAISSEELQEAIQRAVTVSKTPKLIIAQPGKLRIMDLSTEGPNTAKETH
ncbi:MAG: hypothetical protein KGJ09_06845 [Candidatus Omnitrophica bacterium]|nr:hypothetical protein [Candidatus Omnitrophota bacterium]MDE2009782.1 hypothetical protein [Candidatus Omnitrophota bacterium]MDE2215127.1 hypothetical protein [Candidatus Omnitrophota bacterium]MDE2231481.1 hypothetical protein [Candidatus Omnitrophota bacterium]